MNKPILKIIFLILCSFYGGDSYCQKKNNFFIEYGFGFQYSKPRIPDSKYSSISNSLSPKLFLGFGVEHKFNKKINLCLNLNTNFSKTETSLIYINNVDLVNFQSLNSHKDLNYGFSLGLKYFPTILKNKRNIGIGLNFQKLSPYSLFQANSISGGSPIHIHNSNNFDKKYNSLVCYLNTAYSIGDKKKMDLILELNSTVNKPIWGTDEFYINNQLIEKSSYKVNMCFVVIKVRRRF